MLRTKVAALFSPEKKERGAKYDKVCPHPDTEWLTLVRTYPGPPFPYPFHFHGSKNRLVLFRLHPGGPGGDGVYAACCIFRFLGKNEYCSVRCPPVT